MTREEAIAKIGHIIDCVELGIYCGEDAEVFEALDLAITALRPVSREQVEKVWRGEWNDIKPGVLKPNISWVCRCAKCGCPQDYKHNFCPNCGAAMTVTAASMVMDRLEVLEDDAP